jgi:hypothetical protein
MSDSSTVVLVAINGVVAMLSVLVGAIVTNWTTTRSARRGRIEKVYGDALAAVATVVGLDSDHATERSRDGQAFKAAAVQARIAVTHASLFEPKLVPFVGKADDDYWWDEGAAPEILKILTKALAN